MKVMVAVATLMTSTACASFSASAPQESTGDSVILATRLTDIERRSGGRLGVAVTDARGNLLFGHRADERFAMCSTFKLLLAGRVLENAQRGVPPSKVFRFQKSDLVPYSPATEKLLREDGSGEQQLGLAAKDAVVLSDNSAANLILTDLGGPAVLTEGLRARGDIVTRLDRMEPELNENAPGDPRDTTSPAAMARSAAGYVYGDWLSSRNRDYLRGWMVESATGLKRLRAGLPQGWVAGDKTGTCGTAYNDVAFAEEPGGAKYMIAVYLDRPTADAEQASTAIADVARAVVSGLP